MYSPQQDEDVWRCACARTRNSSTDESAAQRAVDAPSHPGPQPALPSSESSGAAMSSIHDLRKAVLDMGDTCVRSYSDLDRKVEDLRKILLDLRGGLQRLNASAKHDIPASSIAHIHTDPVSPADVNTQLHDACNESFDPVSPADVNTQLQDACHETVDSNVIVESFRKEIQRIEEMHMQQMERALQTECSEIKEQLLQIKGSDEAQRSSEQMDKIQDLIQQSHALALEQQKIELEKVSSETAALVFEGQKKRAMAKAKAKASFHLRGKQKGKQSDDVIRTCSSFDAMPKKAFVINFRRLIWMTQFLNLLHELIKSTAIAALTLVGAATVKQLVCSCVFISLVFITYARHEMMFDQMDIGDVTSLEPLMVDDEVPGITSGSPKLLRAISLYSRRKLRLIRGSVFSLVFLSSGFGLFCQYVGRYTSWEDDGFAYMVVGDAEDIGLMAMQLIILNIMACLELLVEYMLWRETASVMSQSQTKAGIPWWWRLGRPSLWFTSTIEYNALKATVALSQAAQAEHNEEVDWKALKIYPYELAQYALVGINERLELSKILKDIKISLVFYDNTRKTFQEIVEHGCEESTAEDAERSAEASVESTQEPETVGKPGESADTTESV